MKNKKEPLIPITKNIATPTPSPAPTIGQLQREALDRLRRINADQSRIGEIIDVLVAEILEREGRLQASVKAAP